MAIKPNVFNEIEVRDWVLSILLSYSGHKVIRCTSDGNTANTVWVFKDVPSEDLKIFESEVTRDDTSVLLTPFLSALKTIQSVQSRAKRNMGVWSSSQGWTS